MNPAIFFSVFLLIDSVWITMVRGVRNNLSNIQEHTVLPRLAGDSIINPVLPPGLYSRPSMYLTLLDTELTAILTILTILTLIRTTYIAMNYSTRSLI